MDRVGLKLLFRDIGEKQNNRVLSIPKVRIVLEYFLIKIKISELDFSLLIKIGDKRCCKRNWKASSFKLN